jgi:hypothetical protein
MEEDMDQEGWFQKSEEILTAIKEWRRAHPKATFVEIEDEIHKRMMQLEVPLHARGNQKRTRPRQWRGKRNPQQNIWDVPHLWGTSFSPWMRS